jgi:acyl carrier protein
MMMSDTLELPETKQALFRKYAQGGYTQGKALTNVIPRQTQGNSAPLSFEQQQWWLLAQLAPGSPVTHESVTFYLPGSLNLTVLERSMQEVIRRHKIWRTTFRNIDGQPTQTIHPDPIFTLPMMDLRGLPRAEREAAACQLAADAAKQPFVLSECPPLRAIIAQLDETDYRMYLTLHDMVCDCYSLYHVLLSELRALYEAFSVGQPPSLPDLPIQYSDYACWQRKRLSEEQLTDHLAYWEKQLSGAAESVELPTDHHHPPARSYQGSLYRFTLSRQLADALVASSHQHKITLHMTLVAAFKALLSCYSGQSDMLIGASSSGGRMRWETQALAGVFANTLLMRTSLAGNPSLHELLERVREVSIEAYTHQQVPYELVAKSLWPGSDLSQHPLFRAQFMLEPSPPALPSRWTATQMEIETGAAKTDLSLALCDRPEGLVGRFEYRTDLFKAQTIAQMAEHLKLVLESVAADPTQRLSELRWRINGRRYPVREDMMLDLAPKGSNPLPLLSGDAHLRVADATPGASELAIQQHLIQSWEDLLGIRPIGVKENFFDLGGDSLLAARLIQRIEQMFGKELPLVTLFDGATIEYLTQVLLEENKKASGSPVVTVQAGGSKQPFFFLHGDWRLGAFWCRHLARYLGPDQPFYALPPYTFESGEATPTFSAMAAAHVQAMRAVQPEGPYSLGGFCNGGMVAYEMAQQLLAAGESVSSLVLINPYVVPIRHRLLARLVNRSGNLMGLSEVERLEWFLRIHLTYQHIRHLRQQCLRNFFKHKPDQSAPAPLSFRVLFPTAEEIRDDWSGRYSWMVADYLPQPYPGKVTVFWSSEEPIDEPGALSVREQIALWQQLVQAAETETHMLPGTRSSCRTTHVSQLAARLKTCL